MSFHTQAKKMLTAGRATLSSSEMKIGTPWYASIRWQAYKRSIKNRVARLVEEAHARSIARKEYAKEHDMFPFQVTNAMIGFVKKSSGWISKRSQKRYA